MTTCTECGQSSGSRLCDECRLERDHEHYEQRAKEMGAGTIVTGPDADDQHVIGDGGDRDE